MLADRGGEPADTTEYKIEWTPDLAGYPVMVPVTDIVEIGAGGGTSPGSTTAVRPHVGPQAAPRGRSGSRVLTEGRRRAMVTDAKLVARRPNPEYVLGGSLPRLPASSRRRRSRRLGEPIGTSPEAETANGDHPPRERQHDQRAASLVSVRRGYYPRDFVLVACGGGGAMHAAALGAELRVSGS